MEELVDSGRCRAIGASNFNSEQLERVSAVARRPIAVNQVGIFTINKKILPLQTFLANKSFHIQVECNVSFQQKKLRSTMARLGVQLMAYAPLGSPNRPAHLHLPDPPHLLDDPHVVRISRKYARSPAQVLIRFLLQLGFIVIPKSVKEVRKFFIAAVVLVVAATAAVAAIAAVRVSFFTSLQLQLLPLLLACC